MLQRGFVLVRDEEGGVVRSARQVAAGDALHLHFADGQVTAIACGDEPPKKRPPAAKKPPARGGQGSLF